GQGRKDFAHRSYAGPGCRRSHFARFGALRGDRVRGGLSARPQHSPARGSTHRNCASQIPRPALFLLRKDSLAAAAVFEGNSERGLAAYTSFLIPCSQTLPVVLRCGVLTMSSKPWREGARSLCVSSTKKIGLPGELCVHFFFVSACFLSPWLRRLRTQPMAQSMKRLRKPTRKPKVT